MAVNFNWTCPHCQHPQIVIDVNFFTAAQYLSVGKSALGDVGTQTTAIACQNRECKKVFLQLNIHHGKHDGNYNWRAGDKIQEWILIPESSAKPQPEFIPEPLRDNYLEACRIRDLSPKASATLARRCLQGMIRDFCGISKATLDAEIKELRARVDADKAPRGVTPESVDAIDHVRGVGNIGAHMEKDINLIIEIDAGEAQVLIELIETLFDEWYVARDTREKRFAGIKALGEDKKAAQKPTP